MPGDILVQSMEESFDFLQLAPVDEVGGEQLARIHNLGTLVTLPPFLRFTTCVMCLDWSRRSMAIVMSFVPSWPLTERQPTRIGFRDDAI